MEQYSLPKISFIVPMHNVELYVGACLESIIQQNIEKEIILVNDGSTDNTLSVAEKYANEYPFISIISIPNSGVSAARNRGLDQSKGEYIMFIDTDDTLAENINFPFIFQSLEEQGYFIAKGLFDIKFMGNNKQYLFSAVNKEVMQGNMVITPNLHDFALHSLPDDWFIHIGSYIIHRKIFESYQLRFNEMLMLSEDIIFSLDLFSCNEGIIEFPYLVYHHQKRAGSLTTQEDSEKKLSDKKKALSVLEDYSNRDNAVSTYAKRVYELHQNYWGLK